MSGCASYEMTGSDPQHQKPDSHGSPSAWVDEKAHYPGDRSGMTEMEGGSVLPSEPQSKSRGEYIARPRHELYDQPAAWIELPAAIPGGELQGSDPSCVTSPSSHGIQQPARHRSLKDRWSKRSQTSRPSLLITDNPPLAHGIVSPLSSELQSCSYRETLSSGGTPFRRAHIANGSSTASPKCPDHASSELRFEDHLKNQSKVVPTDSDDVGSHQNSSRVQGISQSGARPHNTVSCGLIASRSALPALPALPAFFRPDTPEKHSTPTQIQIEELRNLVKIVNQEWMFRLASDRKLLAICCGLSVRDMFDRGLRSLEQFFHGDLLTTFEDIFALMHIAFAAAYVVHKHDSSYLWSAFFQDALHWQLALTSELDRRSFRDAMDRWWWPSGHPTFSSSSSLSLPESTSHKTLLTVLRKGKVIQACSYFLDCKETS